MFKCVQRDASCGKSGVCSSGGVQDRFWAKVGRVDSLESMP